MSLEAHKKGGVKVNKLHPQFGTWAKQQMILLGWQNKDLAEKLDVKESYLSELLSGKRPGAKYVGEIIRIIQHAVDELEKEHSDLLEVV